MSLTTCVLKTNIQTWRLDVYGMGKSSEGVDFVTVHVDQLAQFTRVARGSDWQSLRLAFDGLLGSASFGKPYTIDGIEYVRIYNAPPRKSIADLKRGYDDARRGADAAKATYNQAKAAYSCAVEHLAKAETALHDAQHPKTYHVKDVTLTIGGVDYTPESWDFGR